MRRVQIWIDVHSKADSHGRQSFMMWHFNHDGTKSGQAYFAVVGDAVRRLRHNIAEQFWFDRTRVRLARAQ